MFDLTTPFGWAGLAGTTFGAALLYAVSGFGFALLAVPLYLLIVDPALAIQFAIIVSTALAIRGSGIAADLLIGMAGPPVLI